MSDSDLSKLHKKYAPNQPAYDLVFTHCQIVEDIARHIIDSKPELNIDAELVHNGALLHDIGAYDFFVGREFVADGTYVAHGVKGYSILKNEGFDEALCRIASHHTGVGLRREDIKARGLPMPDEDYLAESIEERLVMYADKFHSKTPQFNSYDAYRHYTGQFGDENVAIFDALSEEFGIPDLEFFAHKYNQPVV